MILRNLGNTFCTKSNAKRSLSQSVSVPRQSTSARRNEASSLKLNDNVDKKVERRVQGDEGVRDSVDDVQPVRPLHVEADVIVLTDERRVEGRDQLPDVAKNKEPDYAERNARQPELFLLLPRRRPACDGRLRQSAVLSVHEPREDRRCPTPVRSPRAASALSLGVLVALVQVRVVVNRIVVDVLASIL